MRPRLSARAQHAAPAPHHGRRRALAWRFGTPIAVLACGALLAISAVNSHGTDLRPDATTSLSQLYSGQKRQTQQLVDQVHSMQQQNDALARQARGSDITRLEKEIDAVKASAGLTRVEGRGLEISLSDAPAANLVNSPYDPNRYVVHQQDVQAVVNALWTGGATAVTVQGQRIISTTGIKCTGSTITLQGVPYPEPFVIQAIGEPARLQTALDQDANVRAYLDDADNPKVGVGWAEKYDTEVVAPAYAGLRDLDFAKPMD